MIKVLLFDLNNVICSEGFRRGVEAMEHFYNLPKKYVYDIVHDNSFWPDFTVGKISESEYLKRCEQQAQGKFEVEKYLKFVHDNFIIYEDVVGLIKELKNNFKIGVVSNSATAWFDFALKKAGLDQFVDIRGASGSLHIRKENPKFYEEVLKMAGVNGEEVIHIDDRADRLEVTHQLGIKTIIFDGKKDSVSDFKNNLNKLIK